VNGAVAVLLIAGAFAIGMPMADLIRLALTALLATIPVALPATFTLSAALGAQILARRGVLLTRLSAAHETAAMDLLCADKTGTLTRNALEVAEVVPMSGIERDEVLALAARASSEGEQDPIDAAVRAAASDASRRRTPDRLVRFVPFDPATKIAEAWTQDSSGQEHRTIKGAFEKVASVAVVPDDARHKVDALAERGYRVLAIATGPPNTLRLVGLMALSDPPRDDSADLIATLSRLGVRTIMVTGDSAVTAGTIAREVGITGPVCPQDGLTDDVDINRFGVFARIVPEEKYRLVKAAQHRGHVVGMCGDGTNDAPALRQAQIGIAVSSATDIAKAAASLVLTEPGLGGIVSAVREGRAAFQRLLTYTLNMLVKKFEIVLFLAIGLGLTRHPVMTPVLMVLMMVTNDFLSMSLTTDRAMPSSTPSTWQMRRITVDAVALGLCKLAFSTSLLAFGAFTLALDVATLQTFAFVTLVCGNQALLYVLRERQHLWHSMPGRWVLISSVVDLTIVWILAGSGTLMAPLPAGLIVMIVAASIGFALSLDQIKRLITATFKTPPDLVSAAIRLEQ
jgi:H+-transporting ATPase